jgi:hypothetical protein
MGQISMIWVDSTFIYGKEEEGKRRERGRRLYIVKAGWEILARAGSSAESLLALGLIWPGLVDDARGSRASHLIF